MVYLLDKIFNHQFNHSWLINKDLIIIPESGFCQLFIGPDQAGPLCLRYIVFIGFSEVVFEFFRRASQGMKSAAMNACQARQALTNSVKKIING
jgi:hypothetical protein